MPNEFIANDGADDYCFGCGQRNERGLRLRFREADDGWLESEYTSPRYYSGAPGVIHGGIQAALLDEVLGMAVHVHLGDDAHIRTAEMRVRYRRAAAPETPLTVRARIARVEEPSYFLEGEILDAEGVVLTQAEARFRRIDRA